MPVVSVYVDEDLKARVSTDGLDVLAINVSGTKVDQTFATVEFSGGRYPETGASTHLIWLSELPIEPGQRFRVAIESTGSNSHAGKTIEDLFPGASEEAHGPMPSRAQLVEEVRGRPQVRSHLSLRVCSSSGVEAMAEVGPLDHGFGASFLWNWLRPERVSASLHTYTLDQLKTEGDLQYAYQEHLSPDAWVEVAVDA